MWKVGENVEFVFLVKKGAFIIYDSGDLNSDELEAGTFIGDTKAMINESKHVSNVRSIKESIILKIKKENFINFNENNTDVLVQIIDYIRF